MSKDPIWLTNLEATAQEMLLDGPDRELYDKEFKPEVVLALCKLVKELGEQLRVEAFSNRGDIWLEQAVDRYERGPISGKESGG